jgi:hypothetical protein
MQILTNKSCATGAFKKKSTKEKKIAERRFFFGVCFYIWGAGKSMINECKFIYGNLKSTQPKNTF